MAQAYYTDFIRHNPVGYPVMVFFKGTPVAIIRYFILIWWILFGSVLDIIEINYKFHLYDFYNFYVNPYSQYTYSQLLYKVKLSARIIHRSLSLGKRQPGYISQPSCLVICTAKY